MLLLIIHCRLHNTNGAMDNIGCTMDNADWLMDIIYRVLNNINCTVADKTRAINIKNAVVGIYP